MAWSVRRCVLLIGSLPSANCGDLPAPSGFSEG